MTAILLTEPAEGIPALSDTRETLERTVAALAAGRGPLAVDTERAQGFRYSGKAYLIQLRRAGAGTHLIDPLALEEDHHRADLSALATAVADVEWILHAASQDLPCLGELRLWPTTLFDTELAARLLGIPKVNLGALMELALGVTILKQHSAADWSRRPLPAEWLAYAALDVERLDDLRQWLVEQLSAADKLEWARQEFAHLVAQAKVPPMPPVDPWRRTSGLHTVRSELGLAVVRELWQARDRIAQELDRGPGRVLKDQAITEVAARVEKTKQVPLRTQLREVRGFAMRAAARHESTWLGAIGHALSLSRGDLPPRQLATAEPPQPRSWQSRSPESFARWSRVRPALVERAEQLTVPVENLISPDIVRRLLWEAPQNVELSWLTEQLGRLGARPWQCDLVASAILAAWN